MVRKNLYPSIARTKKGPQRSQWIKSRIAFETWVLEGKDNLFCLAFESKSYYHNSNQQAFQGDRIRGSLFCNYKELYHIFINTNLHLWNYFTCLTHFEWRNLVVHTPDRIRPFQPMTHAGELDPNIWLAMGPFSIHPIQLGRV